jgi:hypothetical protein
VPQDAERCEAVVYRRATSGSVRTCQLKTELEWGEFGGQPWSTRHCANSERCADRALGGWERRLFSWAVLTSIVDNINAPAHRADHWQLYALTSTIHSGRAYYVIGGLLTAS